MLGFRLIYDLLFGIPTDRLMLISWLLGSCTLALAWYAVLGHGSGGTGGASKVRGNRGARTRMAPSMRGQYSLSRRVGYLGDWQSPGLHQGW